MQVKASVLLLAIAATVGCSGESRNASRAAGSSNEADPIPLVRDGSAKADSYFEDDAETGGDEGGVANEVWNACLREFEGGKVSDVFEKAQESGASIVSEEAPGTVIIRFSKMDALTQRQVTMSAEFKKIAASPTADRCGPMVLSVGRAVFDGQTTRPLEALTVFLSWVRQSTWGQAHVAHTAERRRTMEKNRPTTSGVEPIPSVRDGSAKADGYYEDHPERDAERDAANEPNPPHE